jgi:hypothetical protein
MHGEVVGAGALLDEPKLLDPAKGTTSNGRVRQNGSPSGQSGRHGR